MPSSKPKPFDLDNQADYASWRVEKLNNYPCDINELVVEVSDVSHLSKKEILQISRLCERANLAIYQLNQGDQKLYSGHDIVKMVGRQFGLKTLDKNIRADDDGISALCDLSDKQNQKQHDYIPYSNRQISWHTDGYYNNLDKLIHAMILHCASPAAEGGENAFVDHEILYILMRDEDPQMVQSLMNANVMTIPENIENGVTVRDAQSGPVFSVDPGNEHLHMRYTARTRSIEWQQDSCVNQAVGFIKSFLASDSPYILRHRLTAGQGIICNNVLHNRRAFVDVKSDENTAGQERLIYRGRFYERISANSQTNAG